MKFKKLLYLGNKQFPQTEKEELTDINSSHKQKKKNYLGRRRTNGYNNFGRPSRLKSIVYNQKNI